MMSKKVLGKRDMSSDTRDVIESLNQTKQHKENIQNNKPQAKDNKG